MCLSFSISRKGVCQFLTQKNPKKLCSPYSKKRIFFLSEAPQLQRGEREEEEREEEREGGRESC